MKDIENVGKLIGICICSLFILIPEIHQGLEFGIFGLILITIGIPHGAIDHLISNNKSSSKKFLNFLFNYLGMIILYIIVWIITPKLAFIIFIIMSSYHFGQTHFFEEIITYRSWLKFIISGAYFLALILFGNFQETREIIAPIFDLSINKESQIFTLTILAVIYLLFQFSMRPIFPTRKIIEFLLLSFCLYNSPLLISFIVYFGFWHALPSMKIEYEYLSKSLNIKKITTFIKLLIPFSIISLVGIGMVLVFGMKYFETEKLIFIFFILVSLISFPHIIYMDRFLRNTNQN